MCAVDGGRPSLSFPKTVAPYRDQQPKLRVDDLVPDDGPDDLFHD
jgi:hypothetical protein